MSGSDLGGVVKSWGTREGLSEHTRLEIAAGEQLEPGDPVPGCSCPRCVCLAAGGDEEDAELTESMVMQLADVPPERRKQAARKLVSIWSGTDHSLPSPEVLVLLARRVPGARLSAELDDGEELPVEEARRTNILDVTRRLGLGEPESKYGEPRVLCPLHDDTDPSLRLDVDEGLWYCDPCGEGGDVIRLVEDARALEFHEAVKWIAEGRRTTTRC